MTKKQKLELTWIGKEKRPKLEPRILLEDPAKSYHAKHRVASADRNPTRKKRRGDCSPRPSVAPADQWLISE
jgi:hypothetical protein